MKNYIVFLQPINNTLEVVRAAKSKGYFVIALISEEIPALPPYGTALSSIDHFIRIENWDDYRFIIQAIDDIAHDGKIVGTYYGIEPVAVLNSVLRVNYHLPGNSVETVRRITNKLAVRSFLVESGLSHLKYAKYDDFSRWNDWPLNRAYYFKPTYGSGSVCVKKCRSLADVEDAISAWNHYSKSPVDSDLFLDKYHVFSDKADSYYLEEEITGELISVEGITHDGEFYPLGILSRILFSENPVVEMGSCFPYPHPQSDAILKKVKNVHKTLNIEFGATHTELIIGASGELEIIDLNPRFVGADVIMSINNAFDITIQDLLLQSALGQKPNVPLKKAVRFACLQYVLPPQNLDIFTSLELPKDEEIVFSRACLKSGTKLQSTDTQSDVLGAYLVVGESFEGAITRSKQLRSKVLINGKHPGRF